MPSADFWAPFPSLSSDGSSSWSGLPDLPGYDALTSALITAPYTTRLSGQESDFSDIGRLISAVLPRMGFLFIGVAFCL